MYWRTIKMQNRRHTGTIESRAPDFIAVPYCFLFELRFQFSLPLGKDTFESFAPDLTYPCTCCIPFRTLFKRRRLAPFFVEGRVRCLAMTVRRFLVTIQLKGEAVKLGQ